MTVKLLIEQHLELLSLTGGCTGSPESTLVKMPHCWKAQMYIHTDTYYIVKVREDLNCDVICFQ